MDNEQRSFAEGRLNYLAEEIFGTEMSLNQSITSMLSRPSILYIGRNSSGTLIVALKGMMERSKTLENALIFRADILLFRLAREEPAQYLGVKQQRNLPCTLHGS